MDTLTALATRRSTRRFKTEQINDTEVQTLLKAAWAAPIGHSAFGDYQINVVQNPELLAKLDAHCTKESGNPKYHMFYGAPTLIIVSAKPKADGQLVHIADVGCIMENMQIAATELGLGCVYLWAMLNRVPLLPEFVERLELPEGFKPFSVLAVGYPQVELPIRTLDDIKENKLASKILK